MNFFRRKNKRNADASASQPQHASSSPGAAAGFQLDPPKMPADCHPAAAFAEKTKRKNYFGMAASSPAFLRRRNIVDTPSYKELAAPPATTTAVSADIINLSMFSDPNNGDASMTTLTAMDARMQRRRSIMGVSYLMKRRSMHKDLAVSDSVTAPQMAAIAVHPAKASAGSRRERERDRQLGALVPRRASQCSNSGSGGSSSGDESSGADSDVTLATQDSVDPGAAIENRDIELATAVLASSSIQVGCVNSDASEDCVDQSPQVHQSAASLSSSNKGIASRVFYIASSEHVLLPETHTKPAHVRSRPGDGHRRSKTDVELPHHSSLSTAAAAVTNDMSTGCRSLTDSENYTHKRATSAACSTFASVSGSGLTGGCFDNRSSRPEQAVASLSLPFASRTTPTTTITATAQAISPRHGAKLCIKRPLLLTPPSSMALAKRPDLLSPGSAPALSVAAAISDAGNAAASNAIRPLGRPQRRPLSLGRWRHGDGMGKRQSLKERTSLLNLGFGQRHRSAIQNNVNDGDSGDRSSRNRTGLSSGRTSFGLGRRSVSLGRPSLSLSLPLPLNVPSQASHHQTKDTEKRKMDAWTEDDDEFSVDEYDLSGVYFELPTIDAKGVSFSKSGAARGQADAESVVNGCDVSSKGPAADCVGRGSRLSSTSTVVDECELSAEQYKRVYVSSMRKLQWHSGRRYRMNSVLLIKNAMLRANENYVVVSGGRSLDAHQLSREMLSGFYMLGASGGDGGRSANGSSRSLFSAERRVYSPVSLLPSPSSLPLGHLGRRARNGPVYPARTRSVDGICQEQVQHASRPVVTVAVPSASLADSYVCCDSSGAQGSEAKQRSSRFVTAPMSSPPAPAEGAASIADRVLAKVFDNALGEVVPIPDSELLEFGNGDLVPLNPGEGCVAESDRPRSYRSYRRKRDGAGRRWGLTGTRRLGPALTEGSEPISVVLAAM
ncbi:hypothetical protein GGF39_003335 [Coemansia sp. RSA 1721]|nr:hypothetical protein GGF39_003335 [Coemansia sp. RSA 1721]